MRQPSLPSVTIISKGSLLESSDCGNSRTDFGLRREASLLPTISMPIALPKEMPVMRLEGTVLFPKTIMPLCIFETRYRQMLADTLASDRIFAIANSKGHPTTATSENNYEIATAGLIRMSSMNSNGTSTVVLQGSERVRITNTIVETPYPIVSVIAESNSGPSLLPHENDLSRRKLLGIVDQLIDIEDHPASEFRHVCEDLNDIEALAYFAMQAYCESASIRQDLLETLDTRKRIEKVIQFFENEIAAFKLKRDVSDMLPDQQPPQS